MKKDTKSGLVTKYSEKEMRSNQSKKNGAEAPLFYLAFFLAKRLLY